MQNTIKRGKCTLTFYKPFFSRQWRWRLKHDNGNIIGASTEPYKNRQDCVDNFKTIVEVGSSMVYFGNI